ncbi:MAG: 23S rRNA (guanosine(2251)-2'-O)-methyltransferase RlmB [Tannerella sp.]|uniref:23S rRNA (guanosine(2251)-2'-O)-methyltransferase RlmB n=1 Tax=uncultured Coprobacter sp. TaxID=1720550 RepID=UPI00260E3CB7|nr:23S rRNA (guanosine(2251)-2'-O)-methyltransferase RlmB [uncultured Coprobacter sp.]MBS6268809.1 23S rRNA (guanosine(2251)-2'-O)-methyltransferase RlmB [Tannerella sp.]
MERNEMIFGIRAVIEAVESGKDIDKILIKKDLQSDLAQELFAAVRGRNIVVQKVPIEKINRMSRKNHQGVLAFIAAVAYQRLDDIVPGLYEDGKNPFIILLDGVTDVRNFGAIARTCECAGVNAIVIPERGSVSVNADAVKTSAGALLHLPVCRESSVFEAVRFLKNSGFRVIAASEKAVVNYTNIDYTVPVAIVMGAEDTGVSKEVLRLCDDMVALPQMGVIGSLNVSVAAGVMMYEVVRQRMREL